MTQASMLRSRKPASAASTKTSSVNEAAATISPAVDSVHATATATATGKMRIRSIRGLHSNIRKHGSHVRRSLGQSNVGHRVADSLFFVGCAAVPGDAASRGYRAMRSYRAHRLPRRSRRAETGHVPRNRYRRPICGRASGSSASCRVPHAHRTAPGCSQRRRSHAETETWPDLCDSSLPVCSITSRRDATVGESHSADRRAWPGCRADPPVRTAQGCRDP